MKIRLVLFFTFLFNLLYAGNVHEKQKSFVNDSDYVNQWSKAISEDMISDGLSPCLASRVFAYSMLSGYITASSLNHLPDLPINTPLSVNIKKNILSLDPKNVDPVLATVSALYETAKKFVYREQNCKDLFQLQAHQMFDQIKDSAKYKLSIQCGKTISDSMTRIYRMDGYEQTKSLPIYQPDLSSPFRWIPTPPDFRPALEPNWGTIHPLLINNPSKFITQPNKGILINDSIFMMHAAGSVYDISLNLTDEQKNIADFWDDNPDLMKVYAHIPEPRRHSSPVTHWMNITDMICKETHKDFFSSLLIHTAVSIACFDVLIVIWKTKYDFNTVRPVTLINRSINTEWQPYLVTPPFPEFTSGHSGISAAVSVILSHYFGNKYSFTDNTVSQFGLAPRYFSTFKQAANEASISRVYGGIHYLFSVQYGQFLGNNVGIDVLSKFKL